MGTGSSKGGKTTSPRSDSSAHGHGKETDQAESSKKNRKDSSSSSRSSSASSKGKNRKKRLSVDGDNRNELIDVVLEYVNTNSIKQVNFEYASRLKATVINWQWAISNGAARYTEAQYQHVKLESTTNRRGWKNIRIYVASTFSEFEQERNLLAKEVFPELREWCEQRKLRLADVDLRWGVEKDLKDEEGIILSMRELDRCYEDNVLPFFLGIVGEKIGWVPDYSDLPRNIATHYGWIHDFSLQEMEILHGGYRRVNPNALFMVRDPEFLVALPDSAKKNLLSSKKVEIARSKRLKKELLDRLPNTQVITYQVKGRYEEGKELTLEDLTGQGTSFATVVLEFFKKRIEELYPLDPNPIDPMEEKRQAHRNYMAYYAESALVDEDVIVKIEKYLKEPSDRTPLVVYGEHGCGKSTVLAQSAKRTIELCQAGGLACSDGSTSWTILCHFVGSTPGSTDLVSFLERVLKETGALKPEVDDDFDMLLLRVRNTLSSTSKPLIIFVDAINLIDHHQRSMVKRWLPTKLSANVKVIISTVSETETHEIIMKYYPPVTVVHLNGLNVDMQKEITVLQLKRYSIVLEETHIQQILSKEGAGNSLYLTMASHYIVINYSSMTIVQIIETLPGGLTDLQLLLVGELESGSENKLVLAALSLIYASKRGLLERELRFLLSIYEKKEDSNFNMDVLPYRRWAVVYNRLRPYLRTHAEFGDGRMDISNDSFSKAFEKRFLGDSEEAIKEKTKPWHSILAKYFQEEKDYDRKAEELPYHLEMLGASEELANCLSEWPIFDRLFSYDFNGDLIYYWQHAGGYDVAGERYKTGLKDLEGTITDAEYSNEIERVVTFAIQVGQYTLGVALLKQMAVLEESKLGRRPDQMADIYQLLSKCKGEIIRTTDISDPTRLPMEKEIVDYCKRSLESRKALTGAEHDIKRGNTYILATNNLASIADQEIIGADTVRKEAEEMIENAIRLFEKMNDPGHKAEALMAKGVIYRNVDNAAEEKYMTQACDLCMEIYGNEHILSARLSKNVAIMYEEDHKDLKNAYKYYILWHTILDELLGSDHPKTKEASEVINDPKFDEVKQDAANEQNAEDEKPAEAIPAAEESPEECPGNTENNPSATEESPSTAEETPSTAEETPSTAEETPGNATAAPAEESGAPPESEEAPRRLGQAAPKDDP